MGGGGGGGSGGNGDEQGPITRMVVHGQLVEPAVCVSDLYDVFLLDIEIQGKISGP